MYNQTANIPQEMRDYAQWIVWRYEDRDGDKPTKVPYDIKTGRPASVTDAGTWASFDTVQQGLMSGHWAGIGFVFTDRDPFAGIDLDDPYERNADGTNKHKDPEAIVEVQRKIYDAFDTYAEYSPSGTGLHIIAKGHIPNGRRRSAVELYTSDRFFTMTGNVYNAVEIRERQTLINTLWVELGGSVNTYSYGGDLVEKTTDAEVIERASGAANGEKFVRLHTGDWQNEYPSQSEADQAYMNFLAFYTQHRTQLMRLFRNSPLGQRDKAKRLSYLSHPKYGLIDKAFDRMLPPIDTEGLKLQLEEALTGDALQSNEAGDLQDATTAPGGASNGQAVVPAHMAQAGTPDALTQPATPGNLSFMYTGGPALPAAPVVPVTLPAQPEYTQPRKIAPKAPIPLPPGLLGEIAQYIYSAANRPVPEIALAGAIGFMAGICGRAYNVSATGLNMYVLLLAPTGTGKEAIASGINRFMSHAVKGEWHEGNMPNALPNLTEYMGPAEISSGQALLKHFGTSRSFVSLVGEFGLTMQRLAHPRASSSEIMLKKVLLDLYNKSGNGQILRPTIYSDNAKNTAEVQSPAFTLLGESTPETYYNNLDESLISDGLLPRLLVVEYTGPRPPSNPGHASAMPSVGTMQRFAQLCHNCSSLNAHNTVNNVEYADDGTADYIGPGGEVDTHADKQINAPDQKDAIRHLWNRAHIKTLKLAGLVAVGIDADKPVITLDVAKWAYEVVKRDIQGVQDKFETGDVGKNTEESRQVTDMIKAIKHYVSVPFEEVHRYGVKRDMHTDRVVPYGYISRKLVSVASFRTDKIGGTNAIKRTIQVLIDEGVLTEVGRADLAKYSGLNGGRARAYMIVDPERFK